MRSNAELSAVTELHVTQMMKWFVNEPEASLREWAGPNFNYPYDLSSFKQDLKLDSLDSFSLISDEFELLAFGQCYERLSCTHLGRLVVSPQHRGKRIINDLMLELIAFGTHSFNTVTSSLFVMEHNKPAISAYQRFGFEFVSYPETIPFESCLYMQRKNPA